MNRAVLARGAKVLLTAALCLLIGCQDGKQAADRTIRFIMSDLGFNGEVVHVLKEEVAKQGYVLDWVVVNDIIQPNKMVDEGVADANWFQHDAYFEQFVID